MEVKENINKFFFFKPKPSSIVLLGTQGTPSNSENRITIFTNFLAVFSMAASTSTYLQLLKWDLEDSKLLVIYLIIPVMAVIILALNFKNHIFYARIMGCLMLNLVAWYALAFYGKSFNGYLLFYVAIIYCLMAFKSSKAKLIWVLLSFPVLSLLLADYLTHKQILPITSLHSSKAPLMVLVMDTISVIGLILIMTLIEKFLSEKNEYDLKVLNQNLETIVEKRTELLDIARSEALQASEAKSQFVANTSHELRTPLGAIIGFIDLIASSNSSNDEKKQYIEVIKRNANQLLQIVNEVLDLSKIEAEKLQVEKDNINLHDLMEDIRLLMSLKSDDKGLTFKIIKKESLPQMIYTDPLRLKQILVNLIGNAIKFTEAGEVRVTIDTVQENDKKYLIFDIKDTGLGIDPEYDKDLFKPFSQADTTSIRKFGGTGLGLSLSQKLSSLLNGELMLLHSTPGRGSTFRLKIECVVKEETPEHKKTFTPVGDSAKILTNKKVLVVDDSPDNLFLISRYLLHAGAEVETAKNGQDAVEKAQSNNNTYNVILMDLQMPIMDGYEAVRILKSNDSFHTPIIAFTADAMKGEKWRSQEAGFSGYLTKPIDRQHLIDTIARVIAYNQKH